MEDLIEQEKAIDECPMEINLMEIFSGKSKWEPVPYSYDPYEWEIGMLDDMCEEEKFGTTDYDQVYYDENSWDALDSEQVRLGEIDEMERFRRHDVYGYTSRWEAKSDKEGKFIKVKWVRTKKGTGVRCRLVGQELGFGVKDDELYAGTHSLVTMKLLLSMFSSSKDESFVVKIIDVKSAFLYGNARRKIYIELPEQDEWSGGDVVGFLKKAMYGTRDAPLIWRATVDEFMVSLGFKTSVLQPGVYVHGSRRLRVMIHVDDFLVVGSS